VILLELENPLQVPDDKKVSPFRWLEWFHSFKAKYHEHLSRVLSKAETSPAECKRWM